jgi:hypothetical protein
MEFLRPSRDEPVPGVTRLATASQRAASLELVPLRVLFPRGGRCSAPVADAPSCHFDFGITTVITPQVIMRGGLTYIRDVSRQLPPRSAAATAAVAHDAEVVTETSGGYSLHRSSLNAERALCRRHPLASPLISSLSFLSLARPCRPLAVPLPARTRSRRGARRRSRRQRRRLPHLGNAVARKGAATRAPWRPSRRGPPLLPPLPSCPRRPKLPGTQASRRNGGPAVQRGAGRRPLPRRLLLLCRLAVMGGRQAAKTRRPLLSSRSLPLPRGPARRPLLHWARHDPGWRSRRSNRRPISRPRGGPPASSLRLLGLGTSSAFRLSSRTRWKARRWLTPSCRNAAAASPRTASKFTTTARGVLLPRRVVEVLPRLRRT